MHAPSETRDLLVRVAEPPDRGGVRREALLLDPLEPLGLAGLLRLEQRERLGGRDGVGDVAERGRLDELLGRKVVDELPERLPLVASVHWGSLCQLDGWENRGTGSLSQRALTTAAVAMWMTPFSGPILQCLGELGRLNFRSGMCAPSELGVREKVAPCGTHVCEQVGRLLAHQALRQALHVRSWYRALRNETHLGNLGDSSADNVVAPSDREGHAVASRQR